MRPVPALLLVFVFVLILAAATSAAPTPRLASPIKAPEALVRARSVCLGPAETITCLRSKLREAYQGLQWAKKERQHREAPVVQHALRLASALYGIPLRELRAVGQCESHLYPLAQNRTSTAAGLFQFLSGTWDRAGVPGFSVFDPYANAIAAARLVRSDGSWREWQCKP